MVVVVVWLGCRDKEGSVGFLLLFLSSQLIAYFVVALAQQLDQFASRICLLTWPIQRRFPQRFHAKSQRRIHVHYGYLDGNALILLRCLSKNKIIENQCCPGGCDIPINQPRLSRTPLMNQLPTPNPNAQSFVPSPNPVITHHAPPPSLLLPAQRHCNMQSPTSLTRAATRAATPA